MAAGRPTREELAAQIAALERGSGTQPAAARRPERRADADHESRLAGASPDLQLGSGEGAGAGAVEGACEDGLRGAALTLAASQDAHDEALGVGAYAPTAESRPRKPKPAELAFREALPHQQALDLAYKLVAQRERTAKQLRDKLAAKECSVAAIAAALEELQRLGFQDDRRYARLYAEDKRRLQAWGDRRIRQELQRAGVERDVIDAVLGDDGTLDAPSELEAALALLARKRPDLSDPKVKQRMAAMLARRGIASATVFAALRAYAADEDDPGGER